MKKKPKKKPGKTPKTDGALPLGATPVVSANTVWNYTTNFNPMGCREEPTREALITTVKTLSALLK